jgi:hypothetical protein
MHLERGRLYRAKTCAGSQIAFTVLEPSDGMWVVADLDSAEGPEPNVWLNTHLLLWISSESDRDAIARAADEVIEALEKGTSEHP